MRPAAMALRERALPAVSRLLDDDDMARSRLPAGLQYAFARWS
jgi:hypothetical protein